MALLCTGRTSGSSDLASHPDVPLLRRIVPVLRSAGFSLAVSEGWDAFLTAAKISDVALVAILQLDAEDVPLARLESAAAEGLSCPLVIVTSDRSQNLRHLAVIRAARVVFPSEIATLPQTLSSVVSGDGRSLLRERIRTRDMHLTLRDALLWLVDQPPAQEIVSRGQPTCLPHTIEELAAQREASADYLRQLATAAGIPLGRLVRRNLALRALEMIAGGASVREAAGRLGYQSASGVRKLIRRNLGGSPSQLLRSDLRALYREAAELLVENPPHKLGD